LRIHNHTIKMKQETKIKKLEQIREILRAKAMVIPEELLEIYFPKGKTEYRGKAMSLLAVSFNEGFKAGTKFGERKCKIIKQN